MSKKNITALLALTLSLLVIAPAIAQDHADDVDYLALASLMLRDGNLDRAMTALDHIDIGAEGVNLVRYYTLRGMLYVMFDGEKLEIEPPEEAVDATLLSLFGCEEIYPWAIYRHGDGRSAAYQWKHEFWEEEPLPEGARISGGACRNGKTFVWGDDAFTLAGDSWKLLTKDEAASH